MYHDSLTLAIQNTNSERWLRDALQMTAMNVLRQLGTVKENRSPGRYAVEGGNAVLEVDPRLSTYPLLAGLTLQK